MKKIFLFTLVLITSLHLTIAQNAIAKIKYEEAEEAYASNNFELTISKLKEVEVLLKSTNPKVLYLKILAEYNIIKLNPYNDFTILDNTKKQCSHYLNAYNNLPDNEDKFRDIYKISEALKPYPSTLQEFNVQQKKHKEDEEIRKSNEVLDKQKAEENFKNFVFYSSFKIGLPLEETYSLYPEFKKNYKFKDGTGFTIAPKETTGKSQPSGLYVKNDIVYGYYITFYSNKVDDAQYSLGSATVKSIQDRLNKEFMFSPTQTVLENSSKVSNADFYTKSITYTWFKNNKTIYLTFSQSTYLGEYLTMVNLSSKDENLVK